MRSALLSAGVGLFLSLAGSELTAQASVDTAAMRAAAREFMAGCDAGTKLWGRTLCGPMIFVERESRFAVATAKPPAGAFHPADELFLGALPQGIQLANTAREWEGERWSFVLAPVPSNASVRRTLLFHESFHRVQPALGLDGRDYINPHLDERDGRYWLRLELRALAAAVAASGARGRAATGDAILFRTVRQQEYPGADTLEAALEKAEGLAEFTGARLADPGASGDSIMMAAARDFERRPSYTRALGYGTGPLLGVLLDRYRTDWRSRIRTEGFAAQLPKAIGWKAPAAPREVALQRAMAYGGSEIATDEDGRVAARQARLADYRARLSTGPVLLLKASGLNMSFNPNTVVPLDSLGTVYPTGSFTADWGTLDVSEGGALVGKMFDTVRVPAPTQRSAAGETVTGTGWVLTLKPGWKLVPGERSGDVSVAGP